MSETKSPPQTHHSQLRAALTTVRQIVILLTLLASFAGPRYILPVQAALPAWTAYNDSVRLPGDNTNVNTTTFSNIGIDTTGLLKYSHNGANTPISVTFSSSVINLHYDAGGYSNPGTDAYQTFYGHADMAGLINYDDNPIGWYIDMTFTGLNPAKAYTFATTANRGENKYTSQVSQFTISDVAAAANASTSGVTVINEHAVAFSTGQNTIKGYVARWTGIRSGPDGDFTVRVNAYPDNDPLIYGYGPSVFMLQEDSLTPAITTSGSLDTFFSIPGAYSPVQSYSVRGVNLTEDLTINAPTNFEISTSSVSGFSPSLTLARSGTTVAATPIYVRFARVAAGSSTGNISHTSAGAASMNVAVSGTAATSATVTFQYGASLYTEMQDAFIRGYAEGDTNFGFGPGLEWDDKLGVTNDEATLIRFSKIFASQGGPVPDGATIAAASLAYKTTDLNTGSTASGHPAQVYESAIAWTDATVTWNNFGVEVGVQPDDYRSPAIGTALATAVSTTYTVDVTASLQRFSDGISNFGWIFLPTGDDDVTIYSSDHPTVSNRPLLTVTYNTALGTNTAPVANAQSVTTAEDTPRAITLSGSDLEGSLLTYTIVSYPSHGILSGSAPDLTYNPALNFNGTDTFTFRVNDGLQDSISAAVEITITPVNDAPTAVNDAYATNKNTVLTVLTAESVLANDIDIEGDTLSAVLVDPPATGTLVLNSDGTFTYTPELNFIGSVTFTYLANDGAEDSNVAQVQINVRQTNFKTFLPMISH